MKILNLMWGFNLGGIGKCYLTYAGLSEVDPRLDVYSVCINLLNVPFDLEPLIAVNAEIIDIRNRRDISWIWKLRKLLKEFRPDVVFTHGFNGPVLMVVEWLLGDRTTLLCSYHGEYTAPHAARRLLVPIFNGAMHAIYRYCASGILAVSFFSRDLLQQRFGIPANKIDVVHNGISDIVSPLAPPEGFPKIDADMFVLGYAARLDFIKGISDLLEALTHLLDIKLRVVLIGSGSYEKDLRQEAERLKVADRVCFVGYQSDVAEWLPFFDLYVSPSYYEYHSIALLEAMRAGLPIVATDVGGNGESVRNDAEALLVPARDANALAKAIRQMVDDPELRKRLGSAARRRFETKFTEDIMKRNLANWLIKFDHTKK